MQGVVVVDRRGLTAVGATRRARGYMCHMISVRVRVRLYQGWHVTVVIKFPRKAPQHLSAPSFPTGAGRSAPLPPNQCPTILVSKRFLKHSTTLTPPPRRPPAHPPTSFLRPDTHWRKKKSSPTLPRAAAHPQPVSNYHPSPTVPTVPPFPPLREREGGLKGQQKRESAKEVKVYSVPGGNQ